MPRPTPLVTAAVTVQMVMSLKETHVFTQTMNLPLLFVHWVVAVVSVLLPENVNAPVDGKATLFVPSFLVTCRVGVVTVSASVPTPVLVTLVGQRTLTLQVHAQSLCARRTVVPMEPVFLKTGRLVASVAPGTLDPLVIYL